ncbi:MAG: hypothetical protein PWQ99_597 [Clostridia bacterium]|nr:hypothetical protein [Clostridia bacterium]MDN5365085.1 hypothetical protein [Thermacetogenium sp.]MDN5376047.1 hypothetical protein [Thermacetogenium sp.]
MNYQSLLIGLLWGTAVSIGNHFYLQWTIKKNQDRPPDQGMLAVTNCYLTRYFINILAMFLVYRDMWMLLGTAVGLTVMKNVTIVREYIAARKHPFKKNRSRPSCRQRRHQQGNENRIYPCRRSDLTEVATRP